MFTGTSSLEFSLWWSGKYLWLASQVCLSMYGKYWQRWTCRRTKLDLNKLSFLNCARSELCMIVSFVRAVHPPPQSTIVMATVWVHSSACGVLILPNWMMSVYKPWKPPWTRNCNTVIHWPFYVLSSLEFEVVKVGSKPTAFRGNFACKSKQPQWWSYCHFQLISQFVADPFLSLFSEQKGVDWTSPEMRSALCDNSFLEELFSCSCLALHLYAAGN